MKQNTRYFAESNNKYTSRSSLENIIFGSQSSLLYFFTYATSILSASLGLAKVRGHLLIIWFLTE